MDSGYASQIQRCETQMRDFFTEILSGIFGDLGRRAIPGKWSAQENLAHLARYHEIFLERIERILSEDKPVFVQYRAEDDPDWTIWRQCPYRDLIDRMARLREQVVVKLKSVSDQDLHRIGVHPKFGELELSQWLEFFLIHEEHHFYLIFQQVRMLLHDKAAS